MPVFDKLEADLAKALMSLPASKGFEIGSGFAGTALTGSEHNDPYEMRAGQVHTRTNNSGGIQGGISIGEPLLMRVAFKPTATIAQAQETVTERIVTAPSGDEPRAEREEEGSTSDEVLDNAEHFEIFLPEMTAPLDQP